MPSLKMEQFGDGCTNASEKIDGSTCGNWGGFVNVSNGCANGCIDSSYVFNSMVNSAGVLYDGLQLRYQNCPS